MIHRVYGCPGRRALGAAILLLVALTSGAAAQQPDPRYWRLDDLVAQLEAWANAYPELAKLSSIGKTDEGRDLLLLTIGPDPDRIRPAVWIDGNMHASELCGSSVALAIAPSGRFINGTLWH